MIYLHDSLLTDKHRKTGAKHWQYLQEGLLEMQTSIMTAILGGLATLVASYLARARGSNEPELSIARVKDLEQFIRECNAFEMDFGYSENDEHDNELKGYRKRFEELLGSSSGCVQKIYQNGDC